MTDTEFIKSRLRAANWLHTRRKWCVSSIDPQTHSGLSIMFFADKCCRKEMQNVRNLA